MTSNGETEYLLPPNESDRQRYFLRAMDALDDLDARMADLRAEKRKIRKGLTDEGFPLKAFDAVRYLAGEAASEVRNYYAHLGEMLEWAGKPLGYQADMFGEDNEKELTEPQMQTIQWQGKMAGLRGQDRGENPHTPGRIAYNMWDDGWIDGQRQLAERLTPPRRRPGRPKGSKDTRPRSRQVEADAEEETHYPHSHPEEDPPPLAA